jgi:hypothetical protein
VLLLLLLLVLLLLLFPGHTSAQSLAQLPKSVTLVRLTQTTHVLRTALQKVQSTSARPLSAMENVRQSA